MKTNNETRRDNLAIAVSRLGSAAALADKAGVSAVYLSQIKNSAMEWKTGKPKAMGDDVARKIESAIHEPSGWLDVDRTSALSSGPVPDECIISPDEVAKLFRLFFASSREGRGRILKAAEVEADRSTRI